MEGVVAARRLRKSMLNSTYDNNIKFGDIGISNIKKKDKEHELNDNMFFRKIKIKFLIKSLITLVLLISCVLSNLLFKEKVMENKIIGSIICAYNYDCSKEEFLEKFEDITYGAYSSINYIFPDKLVEVIKKNYVEKVKPYLLNFSFCNFLSSGDESKVLIYSDSDSEVDIYENKNEVNEIKNNEDDTRENNESDNSYGIGGGIEGESSSSISISDEKINKIKELNIDISWPVQGTITSMYGFRDKIFEDIGDFHTGLDIANSLGTEIKSATNGKIVKVEYNNKYYGNTIEIEEKGVIFKYAHLNEINVSEENQINIGDVIGKMGSTGYSTGPHLHFEIRYENTTIDPQKLLP